VWNNEGKHHFEWRRAPCSPFRQCLAPAFQTVRARRPRVCRLTNAPPVVNLYEDLDFLFNCDHDFRTASMRADYFGQRRAERLLLQTNFVADAINLR